MVIFTHIITNGMDMPLWVVFIMKKEWNNEVFDLEMMHDAAAGPIGNELMDTLLQCMDPVSSVRSEAQEVLWHLA